MLGSAWARRAVRSAWSRRAAVFYLRALFLFRQYDCELAANILLHLLSSQLSSKGFIPSIHRGNVSVVLLAICLASCRALILKGALKNDGSDILFCE